MSAALDALLWARGYIHRDLADITLPAELVKELGELDRAIGSLLPASRVHDAGAYAQCQFCKRYSADPRTVSQIYGAVPACACGRKDGWSGSFLVPGPDAAWSLGLVGPGGCSE